MPLVLASTSPRRVEILQALQIPFVYIASPGDENDVQRSMCKDLYEFCMEKAAVKAHALSRYYQEDTIVGADTIVIFDGRLFEKPKDGQEAAAFMRAFSGNTVTAVSAVCVLNGSKEIRDYDVCDVKFAPLSEQEIAWYVEYKDWEGKAGGFGVQAVAGRFIERVDGDYFVAVGLPVFKLCVILRAIGEL